MTLDSSITVRSGFQGSETSSAELILYPRLEDDDSSALSLLGARLETGGVSASGAEAGRLVLDRSSRGDITISNLWTAHEVGASAARFGATLKAEDARKLGAVLDILSDDDWVDIVMSRHEDDYHVLRGRIDAVSLAREASGGATRAVLQIAGSSFGSVLDLTPLYYDIWADGLTSYGVFGRILFSLDDQLPLRADAAVRKLLYGFLADFSQLGRSVWELPASMPERFTALATADFPGTPPRRLLRHLGFYPDMDRRAFVDDPPRLHLGTLAWGDPKGAPLWETLKHWADLALCELYTDLVHPSGRYLTSNDRLRPGETAMAVIFRDKPFPTTTRQGETISRGPWFDTGDHGRITTFDVSIHSIAGMRVGRNGQLRKNAFYVAPLLTQGLADYAKVLQRPLWDTKDIEIHGLRRFEPETMYLQKFGAPSTQNIESTVFGVAKTYRARIRDFHCLDHLLLSGTMELAHGRPDIRVGQKLRVLTRSASTTETYYIEGVEHRWDLVSGLRTSLAVSRGWIGDELGGPRSLVGVLQRAQRRFVEPPDAAAGTAP